MQTWLNNIHTFVIETDCIHWCYTHCINAALSLTLLFEHLFPKVSFNKRIDLRLTFKNPYFNSLIDRTKTPSLPVVAVLDCTGSDWPAKQQSAFQWHHRKFLGKTPETNWLLLHTVFIQLLFQITFVIAYYFHHEYCKDKGTKWNHNNNLSSINMENNHNVRPVSSIEKISTDSKNLATIWD